MIAVPGNAPLGDDSGGKGGGLFSNPKQLKSDIAMIGRAIRRGFPLGKSKRREIVEGLMSVMRNDEESRTRVAAAKALIAAYAVNVNLIKVDQADEHHAKGSKVTHEHVGTIAVDARRSRLAEICSTVHDGGTIGGGGGTNNGGTVIDAT